jgi:DNA N-6-adenine-methyltransferase (Dam).
VANDLWETPQYIFDWLDKEFHFDLDAACNDTNCKCQCGFMNNRGFDALKENWHRPSSPRSYRSVYLNPPYSDPYPWVKKAYEESRKGCTVVCLLPADISTKWFHEWVIGKAELRFIQGRISFDGAKKGAPKFGSMIAIYGPGIEPKVISVKRPDKPKRITNHETG